MDLTTNHHTVSKTEIHGAKPLTSLQAFMWQVQGLVRLSALIIRIKCRNIRRYSNLVD